MSLNSQESQGSLEVGEEKRCLCGCRPWKIVQITWDEGVVVDKEDRKLKFNIIREVNQYRFSKNTFIFACKPKPLTKK